MNNKNLDLIINLVLKEIKNIVLKLNKDADENTVMKYGLPPQNAVVKYCDKYNPNGEDNGNVIAAWNISTKSIEKIDELTRKPLCEPKSGMYYYEGSFSFSICPDHSSVYLEMVVGPRYGRGLIYKNIFYDNGGAKIYCDKTIWAS